MKPGSKPGQSEQWHAIVGWVLFVICALFFMASGWRNRDLLTFIGSVIFLVACLVFLVPLLRARQDRRNESE